MSEDKNGGCGGCKKDSGGAYLANGSFMEACPETFITREFELTDGIMNGSYRELKGDEDRVSVTGFYKTALCTASGCFTEKTKSLKKSGFIMKES